MKKAVFLEQIIAGAILKFKTITNVDIIILANMLIEIGYDVQDYDINNYKIYNESSVRKIVLNNDSDLNRCVFIDDKKNRLSDWLLEIQGNDLKEFFNNLDIEIFILRKIEHFGYVSDDAVKYLFSEVQINKLFNLFQKGYLRVSWNDDIPHEDFKQTTLTQLGKVQLFKIDNFDKIDEFEKKLVELNYDVNLIESFLEKQDLQSLTDEILTLENFITYCSIYDRSQYVKNI